MQTLIYSLAYNIPPKEEGGISYPMAMQIEITGESLIIPKPGEVVFLPWSMDENSLGVKVIVQESLNSHGYSYLEDKWESDTTVLVRLSSDNRFLLDMNAEEVEDALVKSHIHWSRGDYD